MTHIALRMDDIGASTKLYEQFGKPTVNIFGKSLPLAPYSNWLFLKRIRPFKRWGPYNELNKSDWKKIASLLTKYDAKLTIGITATWVEYDGQLTPFGKKFPDEAEIIRDAVNNNLIEIGHHGLTHCILDNFAFRPRLFTSNRQFHREFYDWIPEHIQRKHIVDAYTILGEYFDDKILTFIPPGNVWCDATEKIAYATGLRVLSSTEQKAPTGQISNGLMYVSDKYVVTFHDREIVEYGVVWLENKIKQLYEKGYRFSFVKDLKYHTTK